MTGPGYASIGEGMLLSIEQCKWRVTLVDIFPRDICNNLKTEKMDSEKRPKDMNDTVDHPYIDVLG
jgi:hypothetical protein